MSGFFSLGDDDPSTESAKPGEVGEVGDDDGDVSGSWRLRACRWGERLVLDLLVLDLLDLLVLLLVLLNLPDRGSRATSRTTTSW